MITLNLKRDHFWINISSDIKVKVKPCVSSMIKTARFKALFDHTGDLAATAASFAENLAKLAIIEWEGVLNEDGSVAEVTPENVSALCDITAFIEKFDELYVAPAVKQSDRLESEKNV